MVGKEWKLQSVCKINKFLKQKINNNNKKISIKTELYPMNNTCKGP